MHRKSSRKFPGKILQICTTKSPTTFCRRAGPTLAWTSKFLTEQQPLFPKIPALAKNPQISVTKHSFVIGVASFLEVVLGIRLFLPSLAVARSNSLWLGSRKGSFENEFLSSGAWSRCRKSERFSRGIETETSIFQGTARRACPESFNSAPAEGQQQQQQQQQQLKTTSDVTSKFPWCCRASVL